ncbi:hypothetical protein FGO68_gene12596 [Halteria grandinella]|uniref:Uncharacterized protein n=1 Tax=Halteria grandinella TaxID=5974 RepID=A0A8J8ND12_HALGN|nr:hypothetical protein FGO68_gene12596 [Halteria grandinella]
MTDLTALKYTEEHEWVALDGDVATVGITDYAADKPGDVVYVDLGGGRGGGDSKAEAHYYAKCSLCKREQTILFIAGSQKTYENSGSWQTIARFECRGVELVDFKAGNGWLAFGTASEDTEFGEIDLSEGDWAGYDEAGDASVGVYEFKSQIIRGTGKK